MAVELVERIDVVIATLVGTWLWRLLLLLVLEPRSWWKRLSSRIRTVVQYYTFLYVCLGGVLLASLQKTVQLLNAWALQNKPVGTFKEHMPDKEKNCPVWLRWLSLGTPMAAVASFVIGAYHTVLHALAMRKFGDGLISSSVQRDRTIQVIAFPPFFSLMAFCAVLELWDLLAGYGPQPKIEEGSQEEAAWNIAKEFSHERYTAFYAVGSLYEAYALLMFVWLSLDEIEANLKRTAVVVHRSGNEADLSKAKEAACPEHHTSLVKVLRSLTMQGVLWFVFTCLGEAFFDFVVVHLAQVQGYKMPEWTENGELCIYSIGFVTSSAAITNVVSVESSLHDYFGDFRCAPKFLSTKIMVSITFLQHMGIGLLRGLTELQRNLLYSSLICYEVLALSFFHIYAWPADEPWLQNTEKGRKEARQRWDSAVMSLRVNQKMLEWAHRSRERLRLRKAQQKWRVVPVEEATALQQDLEDSESPVSPRTPKGGFPKAVLPIRAVQQHRQSLEHLAPPLLTLTPPSPGQQAAIGSSSAAAPQGAGGTVVFWQATATTASASPGPGCAASPTASAAATSIVPPATGMRRTTSLQLLVPVVANTPPAPVSLAAAAGSPSWARHLQAAAPFGTVVVSPPVPPQPPRQLPVPLSPISPGLTRSLRPAPALIEKL
mmetsp:Transcript_86207/g.239018  ORF Transcript_86207/g.239018 Transcript_86207/m.239018 type:complete len:660 (+) Transcript_86207:128-2107(+)